MPRSVFVWIAAYCLSAAAGCTMCANTYDECGPVYGDGCSCQCGSNGRAGSVLSGGGAPMVGDAGEVPGTPAVSSDRAVEPGQPAKRADNVSPIPAEKWRTSKAAESGTCSASSAGGYRGGPLR